MKKIALISFALILSIALTAQAKGKKLPTMPLISAKQIAIQTAIQEDNLSYLEQCNPADLKEKLVANVTYLHLAALSGSEKVGHYLVEEIQISPNAQSDTGSTPTIIAAYKYRISKDAKTDITKAKNFLKYLIEHDGNADLKTFGKDGEKQMSAKDWAPDFFN